MHGEVHPKTPNLLHGLTVATILAWLQRYLDTHPLRLAVVEALHRLSDPLNARQPDLSLYLHEQLTGADWEAPLPFLPALAFEVHVQYKSRPARQSRPLPSAWYASRLVDLQHQAPPRSLHCGRSTHARRRRRAGMQPLARFSPAYSDYF